MSQLPIFDPQTYNDSAGQIGLVVEETSSWLTINPFKGCSLGCAYCFRARWHPDDKPAQQFSTESAVEALIAHPTFVAHETPISINISSTDALLPEVRRSTFDAINLLERRGVRNPVGITTKLAFTAAEIQSLKSLEYLRPIVFVSLAFIPKAVEPVGISHRLRTMADLTRAGVPTVLYFRPIVPGWNDSDQVISRVLAIGEKRADAICIGALRTSPEISRSLARANMERTVPETDFHSKVLSPDLLARILGAREQRGFSVPLFKHTSCAVSYLMNRQNYNRLFENPSKHCLPSCPAKQQRLCNSKDGR